MNESSRETATASMYKQYIACLNARAWSELGEFVAADVIHNGRPLGVEGYRAMLEENFRDIPDLHFNIDLVVANETHVASRLRFDCTPVHLDREPPAQAVGDQRQGDGRRSRG